MRILQYITDVAVQPQLRTFPIIFAVDEDRACRRLEKPAGQVDQGGFSRSGLAHNGDRRAGGDFQIEVFQNVFAPVRIAESHVPKFDVPADWLPIFGFAYKIVAVFFHDLRCVLDGRYLFQKAADPLDIGLGRDDVSQDTGNLLNRFKNTDRVRGKRRESADFHQPLHGQIAAAGQHQRGCQRT